MNRNRVLLESILPLRVWDTHTHLKSRSLAAQSVWDILHYFWFFRELLAAGYPANPDSLPEAERIEAFLKAFNETRNTSMNWVVRQIFKSLYDVVITDEKSIRQADEMVRQSAVDKNWPTSVCNKLNIVEIVSNDKADVDSKTYPNHLVPRLETLISHWIERIRNSEDQAAEGEAIAEEIRNTFNQYSRAGCKGIMTSNGPFDRLGKSTSDPAELKSVGSSKDDISTYILHAICDAAERNDLFVQLFLGVEKTWGVPPVPANDPDRILNLYGLFNRYSCRFDLVLASSLNNLDAVQAGRIFPNVNIGAMWWYNFRASTYREAMQYRIEALPAKKCSLVASDTRCIEWCFGKILLVKYLLTDFLASQIDAQWLDNNEALRVAQCWLNDAPASLFKKIQ